MTGSISRRINNGRRGISKMGRSVSTGTRRAVRKTDYAVHDNAWKMIGVFAGLAFCAGFILSQRNQDAIAAAVGLDGRASPEAEKKLQKINSWEFVHSALPITLFLWKAFQASRCARKGMV